MTENNELVVHETHDVFESYDLADEEQIIAEMSGRVTDKYVYTFKQGGQDVTGLSFAGTNWAVREYAKQGEVIRIVGRPEIIPDPTDAEYIIVVVNAQRFAVQRETGKEIALDSTIGVKRQGKMMEKKKYGPDGEVVGRDAVVDPFFVEKAVSKAIRNAKQALIPTDIVKKLISRALDSRNGKNVPPKNQQQQQQRPPQQERPPQQQNTGQQARPIQTPPPQQQRPPQQQAPPPPQQQEAPPPPPPQQQAPPPPQQQAPPPPPPQQQAPPPPPPQRQQAPPPPPPQEMPKDVMVQKLDAVLKVVFNTQDAASARTGLHVLTGFASPADMPVDKIKMLGNTLNAVVKKQARIETNRILRIQDNVVLWQGPEIAAAAPGTEPMF